MTAWQLVGVVALFAGILAGGLAVACCIGGKALRRWDE